MKRTLAIIVVILLLILTGLLILSLIITVSDEKVVEGNGLRVIDGGLDQTDGSSGVLGSIGYSDTIVFSESECGLAGTCGDDRSRGGGDDKEDEEPECKVSSDCGSNYYDNNYCWFGNSYRLFHYFTCDDECNEHTRIEKVEDCLVGCDDVTGNCFVPECVEDGDCGDLQICDVGDTYQCIDVECVEDIDCDDSDNYTQDLCVGAGEIDSYCEYTPIVCNVDADCGVNGFAGEFNCGVGDNVFQDYLTWTCEDAGTVDSVCTFSLIPTLTEDCNDATETCFEGVCHVVSCFDDSECNDGNVLTLDDCVNAGQADSYCEHTPISCSNNSNCGTDGLIGAGFCGVGDDVFKDYIEWTCEDAGTADSFCSSTITSQLFEVCADDCLEGICGIITCSEDLECDDGNVLTLDACLDPGTFSSTCENMPIDCNLDIDCGINDFVGDRSCSAGDVWQDYREFTCVNRGTVLSECVSNTEAQVVDTCEIGCYEGGCMVENCSDGIDNDGDGNIDGLVELDPNNGEELTILDKGVDLLDIIFNKESYYDTQWGYVTGFRDDAETSEAVCWLMGYQDFIGTTQFDWTSCWNNYVTYWNGYEFVTEDSCNYNYLIESVTCKDRLSACSDGWDNDGDGKVDYCPNGIDNGVCDLGCASVNDDSEVGHDIECELGDLK